MPGELGNEMDQNFVGHYERRYPIDDDPNTNPRSCPDEMRNKVNNGTSVMKVLRDFTKKQMEEQRGKEII